MLSRLQSAIRTSRALKSPAIQKWEGFEHYAVTLVVVGAMVLGASAYTGVLVGQLTLISGFLGLLISASYYFMLEANTTATAATSLLVALVGATAAAAYIALPLWSILLNGFVGVVIVVGLIAMCTRRI